MRDLFTQGVRARYTLFLRREYVNSLSRAKVATEREELKKLTEERSALLADLLEGKKVNVKRLKELNDRIKKLNEKIKEKTAQERAISKALSKKIREYDNAIVTLLNIQDEEIRPPVEEAVKTQNPMVATLVVATEGVASAKGGEGG